MALEFAFVALPAAFVSLTLAASALVADSVAEFFAFFSDDSAAVAASVAALALVAAFDSLTLAACSLLEAAV